MTMASGAYGLTLEKALENAAAINLLSDTIKGALVTDTETPDFNADDFYADISGNVVEDNPNWPTAGVTLASVTSAVSGGFWTWDSADISQSTTTLASVEGIIYYDDTIASDPLVVAVDFGETLNTSNGTFAVTQPANGIARIDFIP